MTAGAGGAPADDLRQILLLPYERRGEARDLGAAWDPDVRGWTIARNRVPDVPRDLLPLRDRPGISPPILRINLIPQTTWGRNVRELMGRDAWKRFARDRVYRRTGSLCLVCGGRGPDWPVEADEVWRFDDDAGVQRLVAVVPLCPACHEVRSAGLATANGRASAAARHLAWVERIPVGDAHRRINDALSAWRRRSRREWTVDVSHMASEYGIHLEHDERLTREANARLVSEARDRFRRRR